MRMVVSIPTPCGCNKFCWICGVQPRYKRWNLWSCCFTAGVRVVQAYQVLWAERACGHPATCGSKCKRPLLTQFLRDLSRCLLENIN